MAQSKSCRLQGFAHEASGAEPRISCGSSREIQIAPVADIRIDFGYFADACRKRNRSAVNFAECSAATRRSGVGADLTKNSISAARKEPAARIRRTSK